MTADEINAYMDRLSGQLDLLGPTADAGKVAKLNQAIADWQDFYWSNYEQWPVNQLSVWSDNVDNFATLLKSLQEQAGILATVPHSTTGIATTLPPQLVTGTWPVWMKVGATAMLSFGLYKVLRRFDLL